MLSVELNKMKRFTLIIAILLVLLEDFYVEHVIRELATFEMILLSLPKPLHI